MIKLNEYNGAEIDGDYYNEEYIADMNRLQKSLFEEEKLIATIEECINIWQQYSWDLSASWLDLPNDEKLILKHIKSSDYFTSFEDYALSKKN